MKIKFAIVKKTKTKLEWLRVDFIFSREGLTQENGVISPLLFLAHQHKACKQLKIKQEMTAVGDYSVAVNVLRKETAFPR